MSTQTATTDHMSPCNDEVICEDRTLKVEVTNRAYAFTGDQRIELRLSSEEGDTFAVYLNPKQARQVMRSLNHAAAYAEQH